MIILDSLRPVWETPLRGGALFAAVHSPRALWEKHLLGMPKAARTYNIGCMLCDLEGMRNLPWDEVVQEYVRGFNGSIYAYAESVMNGIAYDKFVPLEPRYNSYTFFLLYTRRQMRLMGADCWTYSQEELDQAVNNPAIAHFIVWQKPWNVRSGDPRKEQFWELVDEAGIDFTLKTDTWEGRGPLMRAVRIFRLGAPSFLKVLYTRVRNGLRRFVNWLLNKGYARHAESRDCPHL